MAGEGHVLAQSNPAANTLTTLLTVTGQERVGEIYICNQDTAGAQVRLALSPDGAAVAASHYLLYDKTVAPGDTLVLDFRPTGLKLGGGTVVRGRATSASVSFNLLGV